VSEIERRIALIDGAMAKVDISDFDVEAAVFALPLSVREQLAQGPWPEPMCGVCRAFDTPDTREEIFEDEDMVRICLEVIRWHDEPLKTGYRWQGGREQYERCQAVYDAARRSLPD
jgi:hypothetical protein